MKTIKYVKVNRARNDGMAYKVIVIEETSKPELKVVK